MSPIRPLNPEQESAEWPGEHSEPPDGDVSWLWYRPGSGAGSSLHPSFNAACMRCDVFQVAKPTEPPPKCWNCGRFIARPPNGWNPHSFRNAAPVNQPELEET